MFKKLSIKKPLLFFIRIYQLTLSAVIGRQCRFYPSCSEYTMQAIESHGVLKGGKLSARRICKCHPFNAGGFDPVPTNDSIKV